MKLFEELSYDLDFRRPKAIICDNLVVLENVTSIAMLSENAVTVCCGKRFVTVRGGNFQIQEIDEGRMRLAGQIQGVEFL